MNVSLILANAQGDVRRKELAPGRYVLGRDPDCDIPFTGTGSEHISWNHAELNVRPTGVFLKDLDSSNGTFLNDKPLSVETKLLADDKIELGKSGLTVKVEKVSLDEEAHPATVQISRPVIARKNGEASSGENDAVSSSAESAEKQSADKPPEGVSPPPVAGREAKVPPPIREAPAGKEAAPSAEHLQSGESAGPPRRTSTTRALVIQLQKSARSWRGIGIAAVVCLVLVIGIALAVFRKELGLFGQRTEQIARQTKQIEQEGEKRRRQIKTELETKVGMKPEEIAEKYREAVYLVVYELSTRDKKLKRVFPFGTCFAVDASGLFGTNGHVAKPIRERLKNPGVIIKATGQKAQIKVYVVAQGGQKRFEVIQAVPHPRYNSSSKQNSWTPDVGLLKVKLPPGEKLVTVKLADEEALRRLKDGSDLCYIGFPVYHSSDYASLSKVRARTNPGHVVRMLTLKEEVGNFENQFLVEHDMQSWGGASGSPIFDRTGNVVAIHFAGKPIVQAGGKIVYKAVASVKLGIRIDKLTELIELQKNPEKKNPEKKKSLAEKLLSIGG